MVGKRKPKTAKEPPSKTEFINSSGAKDLNDPKAPANYKKISIGMNKHTYELLVDTAESEDRSLLQVIKLAIHAYAKNKL